MYMFGSRHKACPALGCARARPRDRPGSKRFPVLDATLLRGYADETAAWGRLRAEKEESSACCRQHWHCCLRFDLVAKR
jgi:hypothetical protein